jgi:hypothetical protein
MRCDECKFWEQIYDGGYTNRGECNARMGSKVIYIIGGGFTSMAVDTERDFFCAEFEGKDDE